MKSVGLRAPGRGTGHSASPTFHVKHCHSETSERDCAVIPSLAGAQLLRATHPPGFDPIGLHSFGIRVFHVKQVPSDWLLRCRHPARTASGPVTVSRGKAKILAWAWNRSDEEHHLRQPARVEVGFSGPLPTVLPEPRPPQTLMPTLNGYLHLKPKLPPTGKSPRKRKTMAITLMSDGHRFCDWKSGPLKFRGHVVRCV